MKRRFYARKERVFDDFFKMALYNEMPPEETQSRYIAWAKPITKNGKSFLVSNLRKVKSESWK